MDLVIYFSFSHSLQGEKEVLEVMQTIKFLAVPDLFFHFYCSINNFLRDKFTPLMCVLSKVFCSWKFSKDYFRTTFIIWNQFKIQKRVLKSFKFYYAKVTNSFAFNEAFQGFLAKPFWIFLSNRKEKEIFFFSPSCAYINKFLKPLFLSQSAYLSFSSTFFKQHV